METDRTRREPRRSVPRTRTASGAARSTSRKTPGFRHAAVRRVQKRRCAARARKLVTPAAAPPSRLGTGLAPAGASPPLAAGVGLGVALGDGVPVGVGEPDGVG